MRISMLDGQKVHVMKYETPANRKRVNLTVREDVMSEAQALDINISRAAEAGIEAALKAAQSRRWREDNADAIRAHNERIEREGMALPTPWWAEEEV
ncbi:type II toxin-antitoxin system CcdA family antitoxin [Maricaulis sp.]|uniref:type II toxin-antitoxin system CcdA family antitoxin n=1 Tax=Maricaulis sp. TaxID=1486257 RepID=UPI003A8EF005